MKDCQFGISPVNYSDSDSDSDSVYAVVSCAIQVKKSEHRTGFSSFSIICRDERTGAVVKPRTLGLEVAGSNLSCIVIRYSGSHISTAQIRN